MTVKFSQGSTTNKNSNNAINKFVSTALELIKLGNGEYYLQVSGTSMLPLIQAGDYARIKKIDGNLNRGDIVVFNTSNELITHRVLHINHGNNEGTTYRTKGDNSIMPDPPIMSGAIIGKVIAIRRDDREMRLDSRKWRIANQLIGSLMMVLVKIYATIFPTRMVKNGKKLGFLNRLIRRGMLTIASLVIKLCQAFLGRWKVSQAA